METQEKYKLVNQGYSLALFMPDEFKGAVNTKIAELSEKSPNNQRWQALAKGFEMGLQERKQERLNELAKTKKSRGRSLGRTR